MVVTTRYIFTELYQWMLSVGCNSYELGRGRGAASRPPPERRPMPRDGVEFHRFSEPAELKAAEPDLCCQAIPMGRGPFEVTATTIRMGSMTLAMGRVSPCLGFLRTAADRAVLQLPCGRGEGVVLKSAGRALRVPMPPGRNSFAPLEKPAALRHWSCPPERGGAPGAAGGIQAAAAGLLCPAAGPAGTLEAHRTDPPHGAGDGRQRPGHLRCRAAPPVAGRVAQGGARPRLAGAGRGDPRAARYPGASAHRGQGRRVSSRAPGPADLHGGALRSPCRFRIRPVRGLPHRLRRQPAPLPEAAPAEHGPDGTAVAERGVAPGEVCRVVARLLAPRPVRARLPRDLRRDALRDVGAGARLSRDFGVRLRPRAKPGDSASHAGFRPKLRNGEPCS